jgi:transcriptional regulator with XRE-family HTH domain
MAQAQALVTALKQVLKSRHVTYAQVARRLGMSEASVKRVFSKGTFTLERLDRICGLLGIAITDLAKMVEHEAERVTQLTLEQEREIVADPKLMLVAVHALNQWTLEEMVTHYTISKTECIRLLARLDRLRIIDLLPNNRIRVIVGRNFSWRPDGPFQRHFRDQLEANFFASRFDARGEHLAFLSGMLSRNSNAVIQQHMRRLEGEFTELHNQDADLPLEERFGTSLLVAMRPWAPEMFKKMQRKQPAQKTF